MTSRKEAPKAGRSKEHDIAPSALSRRTSAVKRRQKKDAITAAMEQSQRRGAVEIPSRISAGLGRAVEAAQRGRKKQTITGALEGSQRQTNASKAGSSKALERRVSEKERLHKKDAITAAMKESQRRTAPRES